MVLTCPACHKTNQTGVVCERCGCELSQLRHVWSAADSCLGAARQAFRDTRWQDALAAAERSWELRHTRRAAEMASLAAAALGDGAELLFWRRKTTQPELPG